MDSEKKRRNRAARSLAGRKARQRKTLQIVIAVFSILLALSMILSLTATF